MISSSSISRFSTAPCDRPSGRYRPAVDCAAFANRRAGEPPPIAHSPEVTTRVVRRIEVIDEGDGHVRVDFHLQSALYKMVRNLVGAMVRVGSGELSSEEVLAALQQGSFARSDSVPLTAPAQGLVLRKVHYQVDPFSLS